MKLAVYLLASYLIVTARAKYDCRRTGTPCLNTGTCKIPDGTCLCTPTFEGYDCFIKKGAACSASPACANNQPCAVSATNVDTCYCGEEYTGTLCADKRYDLTCNMAVTPPNMVVTIRPYVTPFAGKMFVRGFPSCAAPTTSPYTFSIDFNNPLCGSITGPPYERGIIIQYDANKLSVSDEYFNISCGTNTVTQVTFPVAVTDVTDNMVIVHKTIGASNADMKLGLYKGEISELEAVGSLPIKIGVHIHVGVKLSEAGLLKHKSMKIVSCKAANKAEPGVGYVEEIFLENGCVHAQLKNSIVTDGVVVTTGFSYFTFLLFMFKDSTSLYITCKMRVCPTANDGNCVQCSSGSSGSSGSSSRRKRDTGATTNTSTLGVKMTVVDPFASTSDVQTGVSGSNVCYISSAMMATVVALSVVTFILLFTTILLVIKVIGNRNARPPKGREVH